jgi:DNA-binding MarR family transcriptional regulator
MDSLRWIVRSLRLLEIGAGLPDGVSAAQLFVLQVLRENGAQAMGELAERTATDPSSVSVVVRKLHEKGLVTKQAAAADRRRVEVALTPAGRRLADRTPQPAQQAMINRLAALDPGQQAVLADLLERVAPAEPGSERIPPMFFD